MRPGDVRYWHLADIASALHMSAIGGKADMGLMHCKCLLLGVKRTWLPQRKMSFACFLAFVHVYFLLFGFLSERILLPPVNHGL